MKDRTRRRILIGMALLILMAGASALSRVSQANSAAAVAEELRVELLEVRNQLQVCLATQDRVELRFQTLTRDTERLRAELDELESLDPRGVPAARYTEYMQRVETFNESVPEWERQAEELRTLSARCRELIEVHNVRADSLQRFLVDAGIWEEAWLHDPWAPEADQDDGEGDPGDAEGDPSSADP
jgi:chromosome segregation ATPase